MSFAGLPIAKPAKFQGTLKKPEKPNDGTAIHELCRFAGLFPVGAAQNT